MCWDPETHQRLCQTFEVNSKNWNFEREVETEVKTRREITEK